MWESRKILHGIGKFGATMCPSTLIPKGGREDAVWEILSVESQPQVSSCTKMAADDDDVRVILVRQVLGEG